MNEPGMNKDLGQYLPNYITFLSLGFGLVSIILSVLEYIYLASLFIVVASILDSLDGYFARKLDLASTFGLQLDSLTDMVCFGVGPIVLVSQHLLLQDRFTLYFLPIFLAQIWAGAFRLARFNLQPPKENSDGSSLGLTISQAGVIIALMVLSDLSLPENQISLWAIIFLLLILSFLMVSKVKFPSITWFVPYQGIYVVYLIAAVGPVLCVFGLYNGLDLMALYFGSIRN